MSTGLSNTKYRFVSILSTGVSDTEYWFVGTPSTGLFTAKPEYKYVLTRFTD